MIPEFTTQGFLPPGRHSADWTEFVARYSGTDHRKKLLAGLQQILNLLAFGGCREVLVGGSFVSAKPLPRDFDGVWMMEGVDGQKLPLEVEASHAAQEDIFGGTIVPSNHVYTDIGEFIHCLEINKKGEPVGLISLNPQLVPLGEPFDRYTHFFEDAIMFRAARA